MTAQAIAELIQNAKHASDCAIRTYSGTDCTCGTADLIRVLVERWQRETVQQNDTPPPPDRSCK